MTKIYKKSTIDRLPNSSSLDFYREWEIEYYIHNPADFLQTEENDVLELDINNTVDNELDLYYNSI